MVTVGSPIGISTGRELRELPASNRCVSLKNVAMVPGKNHLAGGGAF